MNLLQLRFLADRLKPVAELLNDFSEVVELIQEAEAERLKARVEAQTLRNQMQTLQAQIAQLRCERDVTERTSKLEVAEYNRLLDKAVKDFQNAPKSPR